MDLQIMFRVRSQLVASHAITLHYPVLRLQGEGFQPSPRETLIGGIQIVNIPMTSELATAEMACTVCQDFSQSGSQFLTDIDLHK
jgi:hypothetical protein